MNNTAIQNRTDAVRRDLSLAFAVSARPALAVIVLTVIWISFRPFQGGNTDEVQSSLINQIGYTGLCLISLVTLLGFVGRKVLFSLLSLPWMIMFVALAGSAIVAPEQSDAIRAVAFSLIATLLAISMIVLPRNADELSSALKFASILVLTLSYLAVFLWPDVAVHQALETESQHAGFWRGLYSHKNVAGPIMATITFAGVYLVRRGMHLSGVLIALFALVFVFSTGSKASSIVTPIVILMVLFPSLMGMRGLSAFLVFLTIFATHMLTIGTVYFPGFDAVLRTFDPSTTFTGRIEIWEFAKPFLLSNPWTGFGYDGFWQSLMVENAEQPFDITWDPRGIVHGHNGYLDVALTMGIPVMLVAIWVTVFAPVINYLRVPNRRENVLLADFLFMIVAFTVMNSALESFFFRRADPVWLTLVIALFGLRLVSRLPVAQR